MLHEGVAFLCAGSFVSFKEFKEGGFPASILLDIVAYDYETDDLATTNVVLKWCE